MLWVGALMAMFVNGMMGGYGAVMSEALPHPARATAQNVCSTSAALPAAWAWSGHRALAMNPFLFQVAHCPFVGCDPCAGHAGNGFLGFPSSRARNFIKHSSCHRRLISARKPGALKAAESAPALFIFKAATRSGLLGPSTLLVKTPR